MPWPPWPRQRPAVGAGLAALALAAGLAVALLTEHERLSRYDRYVQPGFDPRVYLAMAEDPAFFTVAPWGYRVLGPWLLHVLAPEPATAAFVASTLGCLFVAGMLLFAWLRRLGHAPLLSAAAVALFGLSPPVRQALREPYLAEPLIVALLVGLLLAVASRAGVAVLALLAALGALGKDVFLFFLPVVYFARKPEVGARRALVETGLVAAPALAVTGLLRAVWTAGLPSARTAWPDAEVLWLALYRILEGWPLWLGGALLLGATPLACLGGLLPAGRAFLARYGVLAAAAWALPFAASVYTDDRESVPFFADDIPRLLIYALPPTLHLALLAVEGVLAWASARRGRDSAATLAPAPPIAAASAAKAGDAGPALLAPTRSGRWVATFAAALTAAVVAFPVVALDSYRRVDLRGPRDGRLVLALHRQSLAFARRLEAGRPVAYDLSTRRYQPWRDDPRYLERMRWFLREGWGHQPHYAEGAAVMHAPRATVLLPCLRPEEWTLTLWLHSPAPAAVAIAVNERELQQVAFEGHLRLQLRVPPEALFRGDNRLVFESLGDSAGAQILDLRIQPVR